VKKGRKPPRSEIERAKKAKADYVTACRKGTVTIVGEEP
jgi:hypothetical protein